jgi:hypothetical protein
MYLITWQDNTKIDNGFTVKNFIGYIQWGDSTWLKSLEKEMASRTG